MVSDRTLFAKLRPHSLWSAFGTLGSRAHRLSHLFPTRTPQETQTTAGLTGHPRHGADQLALDDTVPSVAPTPSQVPQSETRPAPPVFTAPGRGPHSRRQTRSRDGWKDGRKDGRTDGRMIDGQTDGWMDGQTGK